MVGSLLLRGMIAGLVAGVLTFGFAKVVGEPQVDLAIAFEEKTSQAQSAHEAHDAHAAPHDHQDQATQHDHGGHDDGELVSRETQAGIGLLTGVLTYSTAFGGLFALVFAFVYGRSSKLEARPLSALLAGAAFVALVVVPNLKYPANPPATSDPETIGYRTGLFFLMIAISLAATVLSLKVRQALAATWGRWNASIAAGLLFVVIIGVVQAWLPTINEVPATFPAVLLWKFRVAALGMQVVLWTTLGLVFGYLADIKLREHRSPALVS